MAGKKPCVIAGRALAAAMDCAASKNALIDMLVVAAQEHSVDPDCEVEIIDTLQIWHNRVRLARREPYRRLLELHYQAERGLEEMEEARTDG